MHDSSSAGEAVGLGLADADAVDGQSGGEPARALEVAADDVAGEVGRIRYRLHRVPARTRAVKVLYGEDELDTVAGAAARAGLRPSSYVAAAALASAQGLAPPTGDSQWRELLTELVQTRAAVRRYGTNLTQIAAALNSGVAEPPVWLAAAVAGADRATARIDEAAGLLTRRLA